jgi:23S rRNA pseudouridine2605 synthase
VDQGDSEDAAGEAEVTSERLQKVLAAAGIASRRECEELIVSGRVEVDRQTVVKLGTRVDPVNQEIRVDGVALTRPQRLYYIVHKPVGVVTTNYDPSGRARVVDLVPTDQRVFPVGRLDRTSEGLILVTNDGALANLLTHPRFGIEKTYWALVDGHPDNHTLEKLREGVHIAEGKAKASAVHVKRRNPGTTELIIVLDEGRNRQIRRMLARVGHKVLRLKRIAVGPLVLGDLPAGACRKLGPQDVELLMEAILAKRKQAAKARRQARKVRAAEVAEEAADDGQLGDTSGKEFSDAGAGNRAAGRGRTRSRPGTTQAADGDFERAFGSEIDGDFEEDLEGPFSDESDDDEFDDDELAAGGDWDTDGEDDVLVSEDLPRKRTSPGAVLDWNDAEEAADNAPADDAPGDDAPGDDAPGDDAPADDAPADDAPADDTPADNAPADELPADDAKGNDSHDGVG